MNKLMAISPVDGRYGSKTSELAEYYSEYGFMKYRVNVEIEYFIALSILGLPQFQGFPKGREEDLRAVYRNFSETDGDLIKQKESITNHDVKAVEYFVKEKITELGLGKWSEFVHFGLTSQDINNTAMPMAIRDSLKESILPALGRIQDTLNSVSEEWRNIPMLARTHGQPASPTRLGKEMAVFSERLAMQTSTLVSLPYTGKFGGATGNLNAHYVAYPETDWVAFANSFLENSLGIERQQTTTQIEHYDDLAALFDCLSRINTILTDLSRDIWSYVSLDYFRQVIVKGEIGSSAMPHKVNPIDFENAEGNLGVANALFGFFSFKLPVSRLQRDLTDSTVTRNIGVAMAHSLIAYKSISKGFSKLKVNKEKIQSDLEDNWVVVSEAIQTILRREGYPKPYEALLNLTRTGEKVNAALMENFIDTLDVSNAVKAELKAITPFNYTGK
jgi:adenylosuccinate lyase